MRALLTWLWRERGKSFVRGGLSLWVVLLLLLACGGGQSATAVVRSYMTAIQDFDVEKAQSLVCDAQKAKVEDSLGAFRDMTELDEAFNLTLEEVSVRETSNDGQIARVQVTGELTISFLSQHETQGIDEEHTLIRKDGEWLICDP